MNAELKHWLFVYLVPYILIGISTLGAGFILLPLGGVVGVYVGIISPNSYLTRESQFLLGIACFMAALMFVIGYRYRKRIWGKIVNAAGVYLWCIAGLVGFGPQ